MKNDKQLNSRLAAFGITSKDLSATELKRARADLRGGTGGFLSSEELISKAFRKRCKK